MPLQKHLLLGFLVSSTIVICIFLADHYFKLQLPVVLLFCLQFSPVVVLLCYTFNAGSLTASILFSLCLQERCSSMTCQLLIFLRLIKTIIAPLIFGTLVVGIAGHSDLKTNRKAWLEVHSIF